MSDSAPAPAARLRAALPAVPVALAGVAYAVIHFAVVPRIAGPRSVYVVQPLVWAAVGLAAAVIWFRAVPARPRATARLVGLAVLIGGFQIAVGVLIGLTVGFGSSPYGHDAGALVGNAVFVITPLVAIELCRANLVAALRRRPTLAILTGAVVFAALTIPRTRYLAIADADALFRFAGGVALPALAAGLLASLLVMAGGPGPAAAYLGTLAAFEWLSPILPDVPWITTGFIGTLGPAVGMILIRNQLEETEGSSDGQAVEHRPRTWMVTAAVAVTFVFTWNGVLGYQPTPIVGASMSPAFETGDLVVTRDVAAERIEVGDVIRYRSGPAFVIHRVTAVWAGSGEPVFITRGDANNVQDPPVPGDRLEGKVVLRLPKLGWPTIWLRNWIASW